jgi:hypothetical protein
MLNSNYMWSAEWRAAAAAAVDALLLLLLRPEHATSYIGFPTSSQLNHRAVADAATVEEWCVWCGHLENNTNGA